MCRIFGFFGTAVSEDGLRAASRALRFGGPDEQHHVTGAGWGLGCNRLAIQDPSTGSQPFSNADRSVHLVFNGEIYNFREIRRELAAMGVPVAGDSDGSVLLPAYELFGDDFVERLDGMFAIAVVDLRRRPALKVWSDRLAIKSVFWTRVGDGVAFASEADGLSALLGRSFDLDPISVDRYFDGQCLPNGTSIYTGVLGLGPGEQLAFAHGDSSARTSRYTEHAPTGTDVEWDESPRGLRELLTAEVDRMIRQDGPIAVQLSGGLDSSLLATLLRRRRDDVSGFHVTCEGRHQSDESSFAAVAAARAGIPLETVEIRAKDLPNLMLSTVAALGSPNATPHALSAYALFHAISAAGFKVCFVGDGADEQFGGYRRYSRALQAPAGTWAEFYLDRLSLVEAAEYRSLYTADYLAYVDENGPSRTAARGTLERAGASRLEQVLEYDLRHKLPSLNLRKLDHLSMAHSVEARVPYCQPAITRFARGLPDVMKVDGARRKGILREAGRGLVPQSVETREKQPFTFPAAAFLAPGAAMHALLLDVLSTPRLCAYGYVSKGTLARCLAEHEAGVDRSRLLWGLMVLELAIP